MKTLIDTYITSDGRKITPIVESWLSAVVIDVGNGMKDFVWSDKPNHICLHREKACSVRLVIEDRDRLFQVIDFPAGLFEKVVEKFRELETIETNDFLDQ